MFQERRCCRFMASASERGSQRKAQRPNPSQPTFATKSAHLRHADARNDVCLLGVERKSSVAAKTDANDRSGPSVSSLRVDHLCPKRPPRPKPSGAKLEVTRFSLGALLAFVSTPVQWAILDQPMAPGLCT